MCRGLVSGVALAVAAIALAAAPAGAATPKAGTLHVTKDGKGKLTWKGTVSSTPISVGATTDACFGSDRKPDPASGCDFFTLKVDAPESIMQGFIGDISVKANGFSGVTDLDMGVYVRNPDGTVGYPIAADPEDDQSGQSAGVPEEFPIQNPTGPANQYYIVLVPYTAAPDTPYNGSAEFELKRANPSLKALNRRLGPGPKNYRASHDQYISHSEPSIAMDPLDHNHLVAGSKMYERLPQYLFKAGTYESFDGGRHWKDQGQLPGYCDSKGQCDPNDEEHYRTVSDISLAFDDEGNTYANVLDAPGGTLAFTGFNMTVNIKKKGQSKFGPPIVVHDNQRNALTQQLLLDDKNWIAVDNVTDVDGGPNKPKDGKIGTIYVCWGLDSSTTVPGQQIVLMRSTDGGKTWGGVTPGDNTPYQLSQKTVISGIGCQEAIGPHGEVYVTWYDNQLQQLMQVKSTDRGHTFTPARPIANIVGVDAPFNDQQFRNLSMPSSAVDSKGNVYVVVASQDGEGSPVAEAFDRNVEGQNPKHPEIRDPREEAEEGQTTDKAGSGADIVLFKSTDGGNTYSGPVRVNQDNKEGDSDQFQPWLAVTPKGQLNVSYFDRRNDRNGLFIDTYLSRSDNGGKTFRDTRVTHQAWDPRVNPPTSASGEFIGDYQGIVADDKAAIPFFNATQGANLPRSAKEFSQWQEVYSARIPNVTGGCRDKLPPKTSLPRKNVTVKNRRVSFHGKARDRGCKGKLSRVTVSVARLVQNQSRCRFLRKDGTFTKARSCARRVLLRAKGKRRWHFSSSRKLPRGTYRITAASRDVAGHLEKPVFGRNTVKFRVK